MKITSLIAVTLLYLTAPFTAMAANEASGTVTMEYDLSGHATGKEAKLWIPYPLSDQNQLISNISVSGNYAEAGVYSDRKYSSPMLYARWDKGATSRKLVFSFHATRQEVVKKDFPDNESD